MKLNVSRICPKIIKEIKTMEMRMKMKVKTMKIKVSRICPKSITGMKTFQMRMKIIVKTKKNQRVSHLSEKRDRNENIPKADEIKIVHFFGRRVASPLVWTVPEFSQEVITSAVYLSG